MATLEKRTTKKGDIRWTVAVRRKGAKPLKKTFSRKTDADTWAREREAEIEQGRHFAAYEARRKTVGDAIDRYLKEVMPHKPKSRKQQTPQLEWWKDQLGHLLLADVSRSAIVEARDKLLEKRSPSTANRYMAVLSHLFTKCVREWEWLARNPVESIARLREPKGRVKWLEDDERNALLDACKESKDPNLYPVVVLALSTGCRKQEILDLRWRDVDFDRKRILLEDTKNSESRAVPLIGHAHQVLQQHRSRRKEDCDFVFPCASKPVPADIDRPFAEARDKARLKDFRFHDLRHTAASYLAMSGATTAEIAAVLGHKTLAMVKRYAHIGDSHVSGIVEKMNDKIFGDQSK